MTRKQMRMRNAYDSLDDYTILFIFRAVLVLGLIFVVIGAIISAIAGKTRATVVSVQTSPDIIVERHKRGAYTHSDEYDAIRYDLVLRKEDGTEIEKVLVVKNNEYDSQWAEKMFKTGNIIEYSNLEGFQFRPGIKLIE